MLGIEALPPLPITQTASPSKSLQNRTGAARTAQPQTVRAGALQGGRSRSSAGPRAFNVRRRVCSASRSTGSDAWLRSPACDTARPPRRQTEQTMTSKANPNIWRKTSRSDRPSASCTTGAGGREQPVRLGAGRPPLTSIPAPAARTARRRRQLEASVAPSTPTPRHPPCPEEDDRPRRRPAAAPVDRILHGQDVAQRRRAHPQADHDHPHREQGTDAWRPDRPQRHGKRPARRSGSSRRPPSAGTRAGPPPWPRPPR